ncbi:GntR family transcriptional regulator [Pseudoxanthobacter sp.]|uniref:GntR family transcriptional regulator n=1 Tax=Pseudoxanthobacter sp. TaxID=1925742 RepID=UPI002FE3C802
MTVRAGRAGLKPAMQGHAHEPGAPPPPARRSRRAVLPASLFGDLPVVVLPAVDSDGPQHEQIYNRLRQALIAGRLRPGVSLSLRSLALSLDSGLMPVREAVRRLAAEGLLHVLENRRLCVPVLTRARFDELMQARLLLEPACAVRALPFIDPARLCRIRDADARMNASYPAGDAERYMLENYRFHFEIYHAAPSEVLVPVLEGVWAQFGPFMRAVFPQVDGAGFRDKHFAAMAAIEAGDGPALAQAVRDDIDDGRALLERAVSAGDGFAP